MIDTKDAHFTRIVEALKSVNDSIKSLERGGTDLGSREEYNCLVETVSSRYLPAQRKLDSGQKITRSDIKYHDEELQEARIEYSRAKKLD